MDHLALEHRPRFKVYTADDNSTVERTSSQLNSGPPLCPSLSVTVFLTSNTDEDRRPSMGPSATALQRNHALVPGSIHTIGTSHDDPQAHVCSIHMALDPLAPVLTFVTNIFPLRTTLIKHLCPQAVLCRGTFYSSAVVNVIDFPTWHLYYISKI